MDPITLGLAFLIGIFLGRRGRASGYIPPSRQLAAPAGAASSGQHAQVPRPIDVMCGYLRAGHAPPPVVVHHAIAEAEILGRPELAHQIRDKFVDPRVPVRPEWLPRGHVFERERERERGHEHERHLDRYGRPERIVEREIEYVDESAPPPNAQTDAPTDMPPVDESSYDIGPGPDAQPQTQAPQDPQAPQGDGDGYSDAPTQADPVDASPLPGVSSGSWHQYRDALATAEPSFDSQRRVGRYAQRKDRLRELGCDPEKLISHPQAARLQDAALAIDAVDNARHLQSSGFAGERVGRAVMLPGETKPRKVTLSGVLGVAQVAGLEGAVAWFESYDDKKRFPHTTATFARTNGVF